MRLPIDTQTIHFAAVGHQGRDVIERLVVALMVAMVALWAVSWLLVHLGLIFVAGLGFGASPLVETATSNPLQSV
jgi:hypothetical protein